jgi:hypothetical protein
MNKQWRKIRVFNFNLLCKRLYCISAFFVPARGSPGNCGRYLLATAITCVEERIPLEQLNKRPYPLSLESHKSRLDKPNVIYRGSFGLGMAQL